MELSYPKGVLSFMLLFSTQFLSRSLLSSAGEATTAATKEVQFSGWKPLMKSESLSTSEFVEQFDPKSTNSSDMDTSETKRSFLLVYPPRPSDQQRQKEETSSSNQQNQQVNQQGRNFGPPVRTYPTQSRYQRMMNFGASEGSNRMTPGVYQRPKFPPVANPPPLPPHAARNKKQVPNYTPESTSRHQVQIQLLDGFIVPPTGGGGISTIHAKDKGAPQLQTIPLSLNNVPEIRLLLPGDVHQQLTNIRQTAAQQTHPPKLYSDSQGSAAPNKEFTPDYPQREFNGGTKAPHAPFESQRYAEADGPRNQVASNNNYEPVRKAPEDNHQQQINNDQSYNTEQRRPLNDFPQHDSNAYANTVSFPEQGRIKFQGGNDNQGQNYGGGYQGQNGGRQQEPQLDPRAPANHQGNTQSFSNGQANRYAQNTRVQQQNEGQVYSQMSNQAGIFPEYPSQVQRGQRGESFRPLLNGNHNNNNQRPSFNPDGNHQTQNNGNYNQNNNNNNQYNNNQNLGQNAWRAPSGRGNQNYNRGNASPDQQNFYTINNQNVKTQGNSHTSQQRINVNYRGGSSGGSNRNIDSTSYRQVNSIQDNFSQQVLTEDGVFSSTQQTSTGRDSGAGYGNRNTSSQGNPTDQVYFIPPPLPPKNDGQTQVPAFDDETTVGTAGTTTDSEVGTVNVVTDEAKLEQQKELEIGNDGITTSGRQMDSRIDKNGVCDCSRSCAPIQASSNENFGTSIREIARSLNAEAFFEFVGLTDEEIESMLSTDGSYTLFIPSNEAVSRLPSNLIDHWRESNADLTMALLNHVIQDTVTLDQLRQGGRLTSRANEATIFVNNYNNEAVTVNGHRIVQGDVSGPRGGLIHVIDGTLCPVADRDIIDTLRSCNKYDGFLTLADVTKLLDSMQGEGPFTVFLPSNEALTKIPSEELSVLKENVTLLREFLEYHIVQGAYFSGDLRDGQYLTTLRDRQPVRVGIRVDGCYRRLVEANNSPLFKSDIPTKNGVIHVVDWILRPSDMNWCEGVILP